MNFESWKILPLEKNLYLFSSEKCIKKKKIIWRKNVDDFLWEPDSETPTSTSLEPSGVTEQYNMSGDGAPRWGWRAPLLPKTGRAAGDRISFIYFRPKFISPHDFIFFILNSEQKQNRHFSKFKNVQLFKSITIYGEVENQFTVSKLFY